MQKAFWINYIKYLFLFPNELKFNQKTHEISEKYLEAKFRGCFSQVQQVNLKNKSYLHLPGVFIKLHTKYAKILQEDYWEKKSQGAKYRGCFSQVQQVKLVN